MQRGKLTEGAAGEVVQDADKTGLRFVVCGQAPQIRAGKCRHGHANFHAKRAAEDRFARLSKANITEMNTLLSGRKNRRASFSARHETRRSRLAKVQKQSGSGMIPPERMLKAIQGVSEHFAERGVLQPTTKQVIWIAFSMD